MTLFSSTNLVNNIFFTGIIIVLSQNKSSEIFTLRSADFVQFFQLSHDGSFQELIHLHLPELTGLMDVGSEIPGIFHLQTPAP